MMQRALHAVVAIGDSNALRNTVARLILQKKKKNKKKNCKSRQINKVSYVISQRGASHGKCMSELNRF